MVRINLATGSAKTISRNHPDASGVVIDANEATGYVAEKGSGSLVAIDFNTGKRRIIATNLDRPGCCSWLDETRNLLVAIEEGSGALAVVDIVTGAVRRIPGCPGQPNTPALVGDMLVVAAGQAVSAVAVADVLPGQIALVTPVDPIYRGGYARVRVDLSSSSVQFDDLSFAIAEGPHVATISPSRDETFDLAKPEIMLLAGPFPGVFSLEAKDSSGGVVARAPFAITNQWLEPDGPPMAFTGANPLYASGGNWGALFNGVWPFEFSYGPKAVTGARRVALIFVNTTDSMLPAGTDTLYRDALVNGVTGADGVTRSVSAFYDEVSLGQLNISPAGESIVTLPKAWSAYTQPVNTDLRVRFDARDELIADAMWLAQNDIDFTDVDIAVFVVASPSGGAPVMPGGPQQFTWPIASGGTYQLNQPQPTFAPWFWWWKSLPWVVMPAEWQTLDSRRVFATLSHEIGHTIGMTDLYNDPRDIGGWDLMSQEGGLPGLSLPHRQVLGWIEPDWLRKYNFLIENPVDEEVVLRASELLVGGPTPGQLAGLVIEVANGWRYYFEYRSRQNAVPGSDPGPTQVADQNMPNDRRVVGTDVVAGWYSPPVSRKPIRLLGDDGDGEGAALDSGQDYEELDATANATFRLKVLSTDDDQARVRVSYQPVPAPEPPWPNAPDPSIRPWPGGNDWRSPDIRVENAAFKNIPWAGHENRVIATVTNSGTMDAHNVKVGFWVKDFTVSDAGPETLLGWDFNDISAGASHEFSVSWVPPALPFIIFPFREVHYCVVVRITPHSEGSPRRGEMNPYNNQAQSNYTLVYTLSGSPFSRKLLPVQVANPFPDRSVEVRLHAEQNLDWYRTYLSHKWVRLAPGETKNIELMVECVAEEEGFRDQVSNELLYTQPNIVSAVAIITDGDSNVSQLIGGATIEARAARAAEFIGLDVSRGSIYGNVRLVSDGSIPPAGGEIVVATSANIPGGEISYRTSLDEGGAFGVETPKFATLSAPIVVDLIYLGGGGTGPASVRIKLD
ncbi:MAG: hypothetical protein H6647_16440 [Anaerolineales bacterium]|nr:hypothetical protein [Anaerolineae bacterium]MCB9132513.1 hypothetical protein [Anaerolineales bacterium]